ncbi:hypothetical protein [Polaribacter cellanae]|uniref:Uncharacterized protein n=1 Tax=Polaribacter cellanae TaxID=2818493 RepID=A0A975H772_9FLAO|nr:hypothetical protein [Polaribacter cellanae]QTE22679.1 hypothetical protein J3359_18115 [Polaribacter cellanae]
MKKKSLFILVILFTIFSKAQNKESSTRKFIDESKYTRIDKDWTTEAEFKSGIGEYVKFFPIQVTDLKTGKKMNALQLDMFIKKPNIYKTAWVGLEEITDFINFVEKNVITNLKMKLKDKSSEFIFNAKEMTLSYLVYERRRRITIKLNDYDNSVIKNYTFWTESKVDNISNLLSVLKVIK